VTWRTSQVRLCHDPRRGTAGFAGDRRKRTAAVRSGEASAAPERTAAVPFAGSAPAAPRRRWHSWCGTHVAGLSAYDAIEVSGGGAVKCPCLYSDAAPMCRAEGDALRIPSPEQLASHCLSTQYRRCEVFRSFLTSLAERPERWRSTTTTFGADTRRPRRFTKGE
jgi:hypothetical protein